MKTHAIAAGSIVIHYMLSASRIVVAGINMSRRFAAYQKFVAVIDGYLVPQLAFSRYIQSQSCTTTTCDANDHYISWRRNKYLPFVFHSIYSKAGYSRCALQIQIAVISGRYSTVKILFDDNLAQWQV